MIWQDAVGLALAANVPTLIWGAPGIGKTSFIYALGAALGLPVEVVIASLREPSDFLGLPIVVGDGVRMAPPLWAKHLADKGEGLLVLDEITTAPPAVQAALLRVVLERVVGDLTLPPTVRIVAIANPADQAGGWDLSLPLSNRFFHVQASGLPAAEWAEGLAGGWTTNGAGDLAKIALSADVVRQAKGLVGGFVRARPALLLQIPKDEAKDKEAWPSPRSWEMASKLLAMSLCAKANVAVLNTMLMGAVGPGACKEFVTWMSALDLPDPADVLKKPSKFTLPKKTDVAFVVVNSVAVYAAARLTDDEAGQQMWDAAWEVLAQCCKQGAPDVAVPAARLLAKGDRPSYTRPESIKALKEILG